MHSSKNKHHSRSSASASLLRTTSSGLPLATLFLLSALLLDQMGWASAINCFQSQQSLYTTVQGSASPCPMIAYSCIKSVDYTTQLVTRACQSNNCTMGYGGTNTAGCQNTTTYPPQTFCCCYGDGCNSAMRSLGGGMAMLSMLLAASAVGLCKALSLNVR